MANLSCHENSELIEFCLSKQINLFNIPPKSSHIVQPLDKLFGLLKDKIEETKHDALLVYQRAINKTKIPVIVRFAISAISQDTVRSTFRDSGIYPLDITAIDHSLLVVDDQPGTMNQTSTVVSSNTNIPLLMDVFDDDGK